MTGMHPEKMVEKEEIGLSTPGTMSYINQQLAVAREFSRAGGRATFFVLPIPHCSVFETRNGQLLG
jgi:hypothetical protein